MFITMWKMCETPVYIHTDINIHFIPTKNHFFNCGKCGQTKYIFEVIHTLLNLRPVHPIPVFSTYPQIHSPYYYFY